MKTNETIYEQLKQQAAEIFNNYIICAPGLYTANDIAKEIIYDTETIYETKTNPLTGCAQQQRRTIVKNRRFKSGKFEFKEGYKPEDDTREIVCGSFSCSVDGLSIFSVLKKTAAAWKVPTSKKAIFVRETETAATVAAFDSPDTATARQLKNSVANDPLRPVMGYVFADTRRRCLVSCDGYLMTVTAAPTMTTTRPANDNGNSAAGFLISPALLKNKTTIKITAENIATNGTAAADLGAGNFPNWYDVANKKYNDAQAVNLGNVWAKMKKTAANFAKFTDLDRTPVLITGEKGNNNIILYTENCNGDSRRESFDLPSVLNYSFAVLLNGSQLAKIEKANTMYLIDAYTPAVFTSGNVFTLAQVVNRDGHFENFSNALTFKAPTTGAPANLLHFTEEPATVAATVADTPTAEPTTATTTETTEPTPEPATVATDDTTATTSEPATVATDDTTGESSEPATAPAAVASFENKIIICSIPRPATVAADDTSDDDTTTTTDDTTGESSEPATAPAAVAWLRPLLQYAAAAFIGIFAALLLLITPERAQQATANTIEPATVAAAVADTLTTDTATANTIEPATVAAAVADTLTTDTTTATTSEPANVANDDATGESSEPATVAATVADTLTTDTATTSEPATVAATVADTLTTDTTTATTSEPANVANDDTTGESSEPATVADDDNSDDDTTTAADDTSDDSDDDGATSGPTTANGATTTTTTTPGQPAPATTSGPATAAAAAGL